MQDDLTAVRPMETLSPTFKNLLPPSIDNGLPRPLDEWQCQECSRYKPSCLPDLAVVLEARGLKTAGLDRDTRLVCQCGAEAAHRVEALLRWANLPNHRLGPRTFSNFERREGTDAGVHAAWVFSQGNGPGLLTLYGDVGSGRTHLLEAIGRVLVANGIRVRYEYVPDLLWAIRRSFNNDGATISDPLATAEAATVLLLDDVGVEKQSDWTTEVLTRLVDERYRMGRRMAVATNTTLEGFRDRGDWRLGDRLYDTGSGLVNPVILTATSYRTT